MVVRYPINLEVLLNHVAEEGFLCCYPTAYFHPSHYPEMGLLGTN
jgi:hypothetical protein